MDQPYLLTLPERLAEAVSAEQLDAATRPPGGSGVERSRRAGSLRVDDRVVPSQLPHVTLDFDEHIEARELCAAWGIERPVAVSPDVHQRTWSILAAGGELPDPHGIRIASDRIAAGRWDIVPRLAERPRGELPGVVSGASPAYDLRERSGLVTSIEIAVRAHDARTLDPGDPDARELLAAMRAAHPAWRGSGEGWDVDPSATFVAIYGRGTPLAGAALADVEDSTARASQLCIVQAPERRELGAALLDALEAVAAARGFARLRLDSTAFLLDDEVPHVSYGYTIGPVYTGDADVEVWAQKDLRSS
jgi:GNAT superfamily N-acetyltransferase